MEKVRAGGQNRELKIDDRGHSVGHREYVMSEVGSRERPSPGLLQPLKGHPNDRMQ